MLACLREAAAPGHCDLIDEGIPWPARFPARPRHTPDARRRDDASVGNALVPLLVLALAVAVLLVIRLVDYRARHPYTAADLEDARADSVSRSQSVVSGKALEVLAPLLPGFEFNPRDARFLGSPVDLVVFDGLTDGTVRSVCFVEVKSGRASLTARERTVRDAVADGRVSWHVLRLPGAVASAPVATELHGAAGVERLS